MLNNFSWFPISMKVSLNFVFTVQSFENVNSVESISIHQTQIQRHEMPSTTDIYAHRKS